MIECDKCLHNEVCDKSSLQIWNAIYYKDVCPEFLESANQPWIPVSERLPEPETDVLTFSGGCIDIITYRYNRRGLACFMFRDDCGYWKETFGKITHWMPLPNPPKEEV